MENGKRVIKPVVYGAVIFTTLGITIANETLSRFGLEQNRMLLFSVALVLAALLFSRNVILLGSVVLGVLALNLPEATLIQYRLDRDVLLAAVCALILVPSVYQLFRS